MNTIVRRPNLFCIGITILLTHVAEASRAWAEPRVRLAVSAPQAERYAKLEFPITVDVDRTEAFDQQLKNPFDPDEVEVNLLVRSPSGRALTVPAFWWQRYERRTVNQNGRPAAWMYPQGGPGWLARLAPLEVGPYEAVAEVRYRQERARSQPVQFTSLPSAGKGFLRVSQKDPRYFEFSNGEPFFAIGQNLAFIGESQYANLLKAEEMFTRLAEHGANYLRVWTCCQDWALAIESRKSAWGRSWDWHPPLVPLSDAGDPPSQRQCLKLPGGEKGPLRVAPSHSLALRPATKYTLAGRLKTRGDASVRMVCGRHALEPPATSRPAGDWLDFQREFTTGPEELWLGQTTLHVEGSGAAWLDGLSLREAAGGPELLWEADVNRPARGYYNPVDCFMLDQVVAAAERSGIYLQLCVLTRDLYMAALKDEHSPAYQQAIADAKKMLRYAVARWGHSTHVATWEYWNENDPGLPTDRFYREVGEYLEQVDHYRHLRQTSTWHPSPRDMRHPQLDVAELHFYLRAIKEPPYPNEVEAALGQARFLREHAPRKPALIAEFGLANEHWQPTKEMNESEEVIDFHNSLWASALSGTSGTALFWWWDRLDKRGAAVHYRPLAKFLAGIPWTTAKLQPSAATVSESGLRLVGLQSRERAYLWVFDPQASWSSVVIRRQTPQPISGVQITVPDLEAGTYQVQWWDPWSGRIVQEETLTPSSSPLRLVVPTFSRDLAGKLERR